MSLPEEFALPGDTAASTTAPHEERTRRLRAGLTGLPAEDVQEKILAVLQCMDDHGLDLVLFLWILSWNPDYQNIVSNGKVRYARTALTSSSLLPEILHRWYRPPRAHGHGTRTQAARDAMHDFSLQHVCGLIDSEATALESLMVSPQSELSEESLLGFSWCDMISDVRQTAPTISRLFQQVAWTPAQDKRNSQKTPDGTILTMISMACFSRSQKLCKLQKLLTVYFRGCGLSARGFDTLHALGLSMSHGWMYNGIETLSKTARTALLKDIAEYPWFGTHDNLNIPFRVYEQRLTNKSHFDSGTAGTIFVVKDPAAVRPDNRTLQAKIAEGSKNPLTFKSILQLERAAAPRLRNRAIYTVLSILTKAPGFDLESYAGRDDPALAPPLPVCQLPTGGVHTTTQYMLDTVHIEEASYEGNDRLLKEWLKQLGITSVEGLKTLSLDTVLVWVGDQLTVSRLRGLQKYRSGDSNSLERLEFIVKQFGWFHLLMAVEHSFYKEYYGTRAGRGLVQAFELLQRKGLTSPSIKGTFHHNLQEGIYHVAEARFRDLWCEIAKVEKIEDLRSRSPQELLDLATRIVQEFSSTAALQTMKARPRTDQDDVLANSIQWNRDVLDYLDLDDAIRTGDVGRMEDLLPRLFFRFVGGKSSNYATEVLELLQCLHREWPNDVKDFVRKYCWLANTTGRPGRFLPIDMLQEHNIRDIKTIFGTLGPFASWDYIKRTSASIPCQRKVKDHVEDEINHFHRGKAHTSPSAEEDINKLQMSYHASKVNKFMRGRHLQKVDKCTDFCMLGADPAKAKKSIQNWASGRSVERSDEQEWEESRDYAKCPW